MDNQNQTPNPVTPASPPPQMPEPQPQPQPPVEQTPATEAVPPQSSGGKKFLWMIVAVAVLLLAAGVYYYFTMSKDSTNLPAYPTVIPTTVEPTETPVPTVNSIESSSDLDGALNQLDSTDTSATGELNANTSDSTTFTP